MKRVLPICLLLAGCWYDPSHVDETGYLNGGPDRGTEGDPPGVATDAEDDALGRVDTVYVTALQVIGDVPVDVTVVALPGTFAVGHVELYVDGRGGGRTVALVDGGFVAVVRAALGDDLVFTDGVDELGRRTIDDDLSAADDLGVPDVDTDTDAHPWPGTAVLAPVDGLLAVGDGQINGIAAPYLVFDVDLGTAARVAPGDASAMLAVAEGDRVCLTRLGVDDATGLATCWDL